MNGFNTLLISRLPKLKVTFSENIYLATTSRLAVGPIQPPFRMVAGALTLEVKWPRGEIDHPPSNSCRG